MRLTRPIRPNFFVCLPPVPDRSDRWAVPLDGAVQPALVVIIHARAVTDAMDTPLSSRQPGNLRHAYGPRGASALCRVSDWRELVPAFEVTCSACRREFGAGWEQSQFGQRGDLFLQSGA